MRNVEGALRDDLSAVLRWSAALGLHEGVCNHYSAVIDAPDGGPPDRFLLNPRWRHWAEVMPPDLVACPLGAPDDAAPDTAVPEGVEDTAFHIHRAVHRLVPRAAVVLHTHMPYATALCLRRDGALRMVSQNAARFHGRIAWRRDYGGVALAADEGRAIAEAVGDADIVFLANHGVIVVGRSVAEAFDDLYYLERAAEAQILAETGGHALAELDEAVLDRTAAEIASTQPAAAEAHLAAVKRRLT
jgi:ribulose-5-phosphate 4-epimerase/fuculose-1-phosphate aldolase